jgi:hypothetical protein
VLKVKNWKELIGSRKEWNKLVKKAKTHPGLLKKKKKKEEEEKTRRRRRGGEGEEDIYIYISSVTCNHYIHIYVYNINIVYRRKCLFVFESYTHNIPNSYSPIMLLTIYQ